MMQAALRARLKAVPAIAAALAEIEWGSRTENGPFPALVLHDVDPGRTYTFGGPSGLHGAGVQADVWAQDFAAAKAAFDAVLAEMERPRVLAGGVLFESAFLLTARTGVEDVPGLGVVHRRSGDFTVWWKAA